MSDWAAWSLQGEPLALARYVLPDEVARYVQLPGPSGDSVTTRLRAVYAALARLKIGYAYDAPDADPGRQVIRPPHQVLWAPRHATCLDLAVVLAGACLKAGLHPIIVILDPPDGHGPAHSLVLVRLDCGRHTQRTGGALGQHVWLQPPEALLDDLQHGLDAPPGNVLAVDPVGVAVCLGTAATRGLDVDLDAAVTGGARYLTQWRWRLGIDVGSAWSKEATQRPDARPDVEPLREPYRSADTAESPLRLLRAEYGLVPFQRRDELTVLRDWCQQVAAGDRTGLAVVTGVGGSGKTRLALHLAQLLRAEGWYAGVLPRGSSGVGWLAGVVSPVLVVLDYADGRTDDAKALLEALRSRCGPPAVVLCTARSLEGDWLAEIVASLDDDRHAYRREDVTLPDTHPDALDVYHRTVAKMAGAAATVEAPHPPRGIRWTTLDFVLLGWVAAQGATALPASRRDLYDHALVHEEQYWSTVYSDKVKERQPSRARLRKAAVCLSLVAPVEREADGVLRAVTDLAEDARERHDVRDTLVSCFRSEAGEGLALRPDPVGDHLLLRELAQEPGLLQRALREAGEGKLEQALATLTRAGQTDAEASTRLIMGLLQHDPSRWMAALSVATAQGGAALAALERLAARKEMPLPLDELSEAVPFSSLALYDLGLTVDQRRLDAARAAGATREVLANLLMAVSERARNAGDRAAALAAITEAVDIRRALAQANPAAFLPDLATSLNNLSNRQSATGDRAAALAAITEAVDHYRALAQANPAAFLPDLATSLNNLSNRQSETGDRAAALAAITEAVDHYRALAQANPAVFLPDLAGSLNNLSGCQSATGDRAAALAAITEAVDHYRALAQANPAAFLPNLAMSLNTLSNQQSATGDRAAALAAITEAVDHYRALAQANPAAFLPNLAMSLNNLSNRLSEAGETGVLAPTWGTAIAGMTCQAARAELRAAWSARLASDGLWEEAREELRRAAREADEASENEPIIVLERARHAIRSLAQTLGPAHDGLPVWAIAALPDRHVQLVDAVAHAADWPALHAALAQHADALSAPELRVTLRALADLSPGNTAPRQLQDLLDEVEAHGLDTFIDAQQTNYERRVLLTAWIATPTWRESLEYFRQHQAELTTDEIWDLLAESDDATARQHRAILDLAHATSAGDAYAIVTDTATAEDAAFAAIEEGDLARLTTIAIAAPALQNRPTTWGLIVAILHLARDDRESAYAALHAVTDQGSLMLRRAHAVRLRALQRHHPDLDGLDRLLEIISQENAQT